MTSSDPRTRRLRTPCGRSVLVLAAAGLLAASATAHPGAGIAVDRLGRVHFLDTGSGLWRIDPRGGLTHLSETRFHWLAIDEHDRSANTRLPWGARGEIVRVGSSPTVLLSSDFPIAIGEDGNLYYPSGSPGDLRIMRLTPSGATSVLATLPGAAKGEPLPHIGGLVAGPDRSLYYSEDGAIRRIDAQGRVSTVVVVPARADPPSIPGTDQHPCLRGLAVDERGVVTVADAGDARVLRITSDEKITTLLQTQSPWSPTAVALSGGDVYVLEFLHTEREVRRDWLPRVRKIASNGESTLVATVDRMPGAR